MQSSLETTQNPYLKEWLIQAFMNQVIPLELGGETNQAIAQIAYKYLLKPSNINSFRDEFASLVETLKVEEIKLSEQYYEIEVKNCFEAFKFNDKLKSVITIARMIFDSDCNVLEDVKENRTISLPTDNEIEKNINAFIHTACHCSESDLICNFTNFYELAKSNHPEIREVILSKKNISMLINLLIHPNSNVAKVVSYFLLEMIKFDNFSAGFKQYAHHLSQIFDTSEDVETILNVFDCAQILNSKYENFQVDQAFARILTRNPVNVEFLSQIVKKLAKMDLYARSINNMSIYSQLWLQLTQNEYHGKFLEVFVENDGIQNLLSLLNSKGNLHTPLMYLNEIFQLNEPEGPSQSLIFEKVYPIFMKNNGLEKVLNALESIKESEADKEILYTLLISLLKFEDPNFPRDFVLKKLITSISEIMSKNTALSNLWLESVFKNKSNAKLFIPVLEELFGSNNLENMKFAFNFLHFSKESCPIVDLNNQKHNIFSKDRRLAELTMAYIRNQCISHKMDSLQFVDLLLHELSCISSPDVYDDFGPHKNIVDLITRNVGMLSQPILVLSPAGFLVPVPDPDPDPDAARKQLVRAHIVRNHLELFSRLLRMDCQFNLFQEFYFIFDTIFAEIVQTCVENEIISTMDVYAFKKCVDAILYKLKSEDVNTKYMSVRALMSFCHKDSTFGCVNHLISADNLPTIIDAIEQPDKRFSEQSLVLFCNYLINHYIKSMNNMNSSDLNRKLVEVFVQKLRNSESSPNVVKGAIFGMWKLVISDRTLVSAQKLKELTGGIPFLKKIGQGNVPPASLGQINTLIDFLVSVENEELKTLAS